MEQEINSDEENKRKDKLIARLGFWLGMLMVVVSLMVFYLGTKYMDIIAGALFGWLMGS